MIYLFSTKLALRRAMVGLTSKNTQFDNVTGLMQSIGNYLTEGGLSKMDAKIKAQEEIVLSLKRLSKSLADEIEGREASIEAKIKYRKRIHADIEGAYGELNKVNDDIATAQEQLDSLVAQIGAAERETPSTEAGVAYHESFDKALQSGALADWVGSQDLDQ